jgi:F-type H+/Na+-transporting ATPase subunit alpha
MSDQILKDITSDLQSRIESYEPQYEIRAVGSVVEAGDGIAQAEGLLGVRAQELVEFDNGVMGIAFNLTQKLVGIIVLGDYSEVTEGMAVRSTGRIASVPVGDGLIGRVINPLGEPIDGKGKLNFSRYRPIERIAPGVVERQDVDTPVQTGIKAIDAMIPIGRGQRQLIIGDRQTGKSAIVVDTIINQKGKNLTCIYVAIGQKKSAIARTIALLERYGAMDHTIIVMASADEAAALQYIAPYAGCAIGEEFMETGRDALVIYDDLSKHAWAYRQVSLLMRRPPGREAYPGDLFYLHSRLLERAARLAEDTAIVPASFEGHEAERSDAVNGKVFTGVQSQHEAEEARKAMENPDQYKSIKIKGTGGSLTALPIIETLLSDVSAYVPTNVISITDGQIYLESSLFNAGVRPAINIGISVSRVGGAAQSKAIRQVASRLRLDMASYRDLAAFAQFGSDLDKSTQQQLNRGQRIQEILKQPQYQPMSLEHQVVVMFAGTNGFADQVPIDQVLDWEKELIHYMDTTYPTLLADIANRKVLTDDTMKQLREALQAFTVSWKSQHVSTQG